MAINKNHEFEELNGVKCGIVERNVKPDRVEFLRKILEYNGFTVVAVPSPPPKVAAPAKASEGAAPTKATVTSVPVNTATETQAPAQPQTSNLSEGVRSPSDKLQTVDPPPPPETFTVGVSDYTFNPINAIFGRQLKTTDGHFVTLAYWKQEEAVSDDEKPYYE
jgi:hypothetical protein